MIAAQLRRPGRAGSFGGDAGIALASFSKFGAAVAGRTYVRESEKTAQLPRTARNSAGVAPKHMRRHSLVAAARAMRGGEPMVDANQVLESVETALAKAGALPLSCLSRARVGRMGA